MPSEGSGTNGEVAVTVVVPVYNEGRHVERALRSILANDVHGGVEIVVVDGMSTDGTREAVKRLAERHPRIRLLDNPHRAVPHAMNLAICEARGAVVVRVDGHAEIAPDFLATCLKELNDRPECGCVGGTIDHVPEGEHARAISMAMASPFGVGNATFRVGGRDGYVDTLAFGAYRKSALLEIGLFDEELIRNQDDELNFRLRRAGHRIWLSNRIRARYYARSTFRSLFRQYYQYGYWKVFVNRKHGVVTSVRQLIPPSFVLGLAVLALAPLAWPATRWMAVALLAAYMTAAALFALRKARSLQRVPKVVLAFATLHFGYGLGYLEGILHFHVLRKGPRVRHSQISR